MSRRKPRAAARSRRCATATLSSIDPGARTVTLEVPAEEIARRMADWRAPASIAAVRPGSVHDKYIRLVSSAHYGCVL